MSKIKQNRLSVQNAVIEPVLFISFFITSCYILARIHPYYDHRKEGQNMRRIDHDEKFGLEQAFNYLYKTGEKYAQAVFLGGKVRRENVSPSIGAGEGRH